MGGTGKQDGGFLLFILLAQKNPICSVRNYLPESTRAFQTQSMAYDVLGTKE